MELKKNKLFTTFLCLLILGCNEEIIKKTSPKKKMTHVESMGLNGKVKLYESSTYNVSYKFGEPVFDLWSSSLTSYNIFGFHTEIETKYQSKYYNSESKYTYEYSDLELGLIKSRSFETIDDGKHKDWEQTFKYDSISNKLLEMKHYDKQKKSSNLFIYKYEDRLTRIKEYDVENNLINIQIEKKDENGNLISSIEYDDEGIEKDERYLIRKNNKIHKDSTIFRYSTSKGFDTYVYTFDESNRVVEYVKYDDEDNIEGYFLEYDDSEKNSSFVKREFKRNKDLVYKTLRVDQKSDDNGNIIEILIKNLDNNKLEEKTIKKITYYNNSEY